MSSVLDASAVLAILNREPGGEIAAERLPDATMSVVNAIEVGSKLMDGGMTFEAAWEALDLLEVPLRDLDMDITMAATALREKTRSRGLSLADRTCLALTIREGSTAVTADRAWAALDVGCKIEMIR
jgi:PIN domain nuclease of toxin-antitoxin system